MSDSQEAQLTFWLDVLEEIINGRPNGHECPFCGHKPLETEVKGPLIKVKCTSCGEFFNGRMPY
ncbi:MAG: hypothetical protein KC561_03315 [Myxococcales bacterium]|nr:hypothetical protein [Myxococcales bacterium]